MNREKDEFDFMPGETIELEDIEEFLLRQHLKHQGGYEYEGTWRGDEFLVAELDHRGRPTLCSYTRDHLMEWVENANELSRTADPDGEWPCSLWDAAPETESLST